MQQPSYINKIEMQFGLFGMYVCPSFEYLTFFYSNLQQYVVSFIVCGKIADCLNQLKMIKIKKKNVVYFTLIQTPYLFIMMLFLCADDTHKSKNSFDQKEPDHHISQHTAVTILFGENILVKISQWTIQPTNATEASQLTQRICSA